MTDYISKDALSELVGEPIEVFLGRLDLKLPPTVEAEPVRHGEWVDEGYYADYTNVSAWRCSECGWHMIRYAHELFRYCPTCGAKMDMREEKWQGK